MTDSKKYLSPDEYCKLKGISRKILNRVIKEEMVLVKRISKRKILIKTEYTFDLELKSELINKYSQYFEDAVSSVLVIMPKWIPANSEVKNINSRVNIPVKFKTSE